MNTLIPVLSTPTETLLAEIASTKFTRRQIAATYALAMRDPSNVDWPTVNEAIINRWSRSALVHIKTIAWGILEGKVKL